MTYYSQLDSRWKNKKFYGDLTFGGFGCFVVSLAMLDGRTPPEVASVLRANNAFASGGLLITEKAKNALGLDYGGKITIPPDRVCIAETDAYKSKGVPQHFFVWLGNGRIHDPLGGENIPNKYNIVSFRLFEPKQQETNTMCKINDERALHMRRHLVFNTFNLVLGREGEPEEQTVVDNADWIDRASGDSFNYKGMAEYVVNLYNSAEAKAHRSKEANEIRKELANVKKELEASEKMVAEQAEEIKILVKENDALEDLQIQLEALTSGRPSLWEWLKELLNKWRK